MEDHRFTIFPEDLPSQPLPYLTAGSVKSGSQVYGSLENYYNDQRAKRKKKWKEHCFNEIHQTNSVHTFFFSFISMPKERHAHTFTMERNELASHIKLSLVQTTHLKNKKNMLLLACKSFNHRIQHSSFAKENKEKKIE